MGINKRLKQPERQTSQKNVEARLCRAQKPTMVFSFAKITKDNEHNFNCLEGFKSEAINCTIQLFNKIKVMSSQSWDEFWGQGKKHGPEPIPADVFDQTFINNLPFLIAKDEKLYSVRFNGQNSRFILKKGTKCGRVIHLLGIDYKLNLYEH